VPLLRSSFPSGLVHISFSAATRRSTSFHFFSSRYTFASFRLVLNHSRSLLELFSAIRVISYISDSTCMSVAVARVSKMTLIASVHSFRVTEDM
jgi:hypothetical protein